LCKESEAVAAGERWGRRGVAISGEALSPSVGQLPRGKTASARQPAGLHSAPCLFPTAFTMSLVPLQLTTRAVKRLIFGLYRMIQV